MDIDHDESYISSKYVMVHVCVVRMNQGIAHNFIYVQFICSLIRFLWWS